MRFLLAVIVAAVTCAAPALGASDPEQVEIPRGEGRLKAALYRPAGDGPFPVVIGLHNCGGLNNRSDAIASRYRDWGERLVKDGFAVLLPDSNGSRGLGNQCRARNRPIRVERERVADAHAARVWVQQQPWAAPDRI